MSLMEFTGKRRFQAVALGGELDLFFGCTKELLEQQFQVRSLPGGKLRRILSREGAKSTRGGRVDWERLWGFSLREAQP